ncbi:MAG: four helix bundle protein [Mangrovibacterium sp.]
MNNFKELTVWKRSIEMVGKIYSTTTGFPKEEIYGIVNQIRRAAVSVPSNIAEGAGRNTGKEFAHFLAIALGSCFELETQLIIAKNLGFLPEEELNRLEDSLGEIQKMLRGLQKSLS